jgi:hypothetical protein
VCCVHSIPQVALDAALRMVLTIPLHDLLAFRKAAKAYFALLEVRWGVYGLGCTRTRTRTRAGHSFHARVAAPPAALAAPGPRVRGWRRVHARVVHTHTRVSYTHAHTHTRVIHTAWRQVLAAGHAGVLAGQEAPTFLYLLSSIELGLK